MDGIATPSSYTAPLEETNGRVYACLTTPLTPRWFPRSPNLSARAEDLRQAGFRVGASARVVGDDSRGRKKLAVAAQTLHAHLEPNRQISHRRAVGRCFLILAEDQGGARWACDSSGV